jgi:hypothetical protein
MRGGASPLIKEAEFLLMGMDVLWKSGRWQPGRQAHCQRPVLMDVISTDVAITGTGGAGFRPK